MKFLTPRPRVKWVRIEGKLLYLKRKILISGPFSFFYFAQKRPKLTHFTRGRGVNSGGDVNRSATRTLSNVKDSFDSFKRKAISYVQASGEAASFVCETAVIKNVKDDIKDN